MASSSQPRLQQWSNRSTQRVFVHAQPAQTTKCTPNRPRILKQSTPSLDSWQFLICPARQSLHYSQTVCSTQSPKRRSSSRPTNKSRTPPRSEEHDRIFDREKALRLDDEIMNFQWISTILWSDIKDLRGSTVVQPLARLRCALQQTQHAILRAILHHGSSSRGSQPAWKVVLFSSSWAVQPRTQQTAIGPVSWKHDWTSSGLRTSASLDHGQSRMRRHHNHTG